MITLYPAIDLQGGQAVRLVQGDFAASTTFNEDPVDQARCSPTTARPPCTSSTWTAPATAFRCRRRWWPRSPTAFPGDVHLGGGLRTRAAIETAVATGVHRIVLGTVALQDRELLDWAVDRLGDRLVVAIDAREGKVATHGWTQVSDRDAVRGRRGAGGAGVRRLIYTDIIRDGTLGGPNLNAMRRLAEVAPPLRLIASGGISSLADLRRAARPRASPICPA